MMWGGISFNHRTPLHHVNGNLTGQRYRDDILNRVALPTLQAIGNGAVLQDDNARPHRAAVVTNFLQEQGVVRMPWPANSPDLSPIEHLWDVLGRAVRRNHPPAVNQQQLIQFLQQEWAAIPQASIRNLIRSMRRRCTACLHARGGHTRY
jgi:transposase